MNGAALNLLEQEGWETVSKGGRGFVLQTGYEQIIPLAYNDTVDIRLEKSAVWLSGTSRFSCWAIRLPTK